MKSKVRLSSVRQCFTHQVWSSPLKPTVRCFFVVSKFGGSISKSTTIRFDMPNEIAFQWDIDLELVRVHSKVIINLTLFSRMTLIAFYAPEHNTFNNIFRKKFNFSRTKVRIFCCSNKIQVVYDFFNCERCIRSPILMSRSSAYILFTRVECWTKSYSMLL